MSAAAPLSYGQERMWILSQLAGDASALNLVTAVRLRGRLNVPALRQAFEDICRRHEVLRSVIVRRDGRPAQAPGPPRLPPVHHAELGGLPPATARRQIDRLLRAHTRTPFDLTRGPLLRMTVLSTAAREHLVVLAMHHIVTDAWSVDLLARELSTLYRAYIGGDPGPLAGRPVEQYREYARRQRDAASERELEPALKYWTGQLRDPPDPDPALPRPAVPVGPGAATWTAALAPSRTARLRQLQRDTGCSLFMLVLAALSALVHRLDGRPDVVVGTLVAGRTRPELDGTLGFFVNVLPIRTAFGDGPTFRALCHRVRDACVAGYAHQDLPYERLLAELRRDRSADAAPLVRVLCVAQQPAPPVDLPALAAEPVDVPHATAQFDLVVEVRERADAVRLAIQYDTTRYDAATVAMFGEYLTALLDTVPADPDRPCAELPLPVLPRAVYEPAPAGVEHSMPELFEARVAAAPDAVAVAGRTGTLTYAELNRRANRLARHLRAGGVRAEDRVGVCLDRSPESTVALLAALKAGAAYLPLDPADPTDRLAYLLADARPRLVVTTAAYRDRLGPAAPTVQLDADADVIAARPDRDLGQPPHPDQVAYLIYTSGSTGRPKGVLGTHRGAVNRFRWMWDTYPFGPGERAVQRSALGFVDSVWETFGPLLAGTPVEIVDADTGRDPARLVETLARSGVTRIVLVPALLRAILDTEPDLDRRLPALRRWTCSGERLPAELAARFHAALPGRTLLNLYGSAEVAADVTAADLAAGQAPDPVPIGGPIPNLAVTVSTGAGDPVPPLLAGELWVAGAGLARGYHDRPGLTAARFRPYPHGGDSGARAFVTGDRCRARADGTLDYLGRLDDQVQVRGHRVEPGEIEAALLEHPAVTAAAVAARPDGAGGTVLAGYVVTAGTVPVAELREHLRHRLPVALVPASLVAVATLPYTPSGKLDRHRLPELPAAPGGPRGGEPDRPGRRPASPAEHAVATTYAELLPVRWRDVDDDFFGLGGHSILATLAVHRLGERCGVELRLRDLFDRPSIAGLAAAIEDRQHDQPHAAGRPADETTAITPDPAAWFEPFPLTDVQQAYWIGRDPDLELGDVATHAYFELDAADLDPAALDAALQRLIERHHALRTVISPDGRQRVLAEVPPYRMPVADLRAEPPDATAARLAAIRDEMSHQVLPAGTWPLFDIRASLLDGGRVRLHVSIDALIADAYSVQVLLRQLGWLLRDPDHRLAPLELSFRDCVLAEQAGRAGPGYRRALAYWRDRLADLPGGPELPLRQAPGDVRAPRFRRRSARLDPDRWDRLAEHAARAGLSPSGVLLAAFAEVLTTWSGRPHYTLTLTLFNRHAGHPQVDELVGDFTSLVLLEVDHRTPGSFLARARTLQQRLWADLDHRAVSAVTVMREWARLRERMPRLTAPVVFTSNLELDRDRDPAEPGHGIGTIGYAITQTPQLYLDHQVAQGPDGLRLNWDAVEDLFPPGLVDEMFAGYVGLLHRLATDPAEWDRPVRGLLSPAQLARRAAANDTAVPPSAECLHTLVAATATRQPDALAVVSGDRRLTYREVSARAAAVAHALRARGAGRGQVVGIAMTKGWEQAVAVLGVSASGAAYLPLDPDLPATRMRQLAELVGLEHVLTQPALLGRLPGLEQVGQLVVDGAEPVAGDPAGLVALSEPGGSGVDPADLAYVIFTSGSTGTPKGVMIDHRGAVNTVLDISRRFRVGRDDRVLALSALSFDLSVYDIVGTLAAGGVLVFPEHARRRDPAHWVELVAAERITVWNSVPALLGLAVDYLELPSRAGSVAALRSLRLAMLSGDWIPVALPDRVRRLAGPVDVVSLGGATEASIWSVAYPIGAVDPDWTSVPYGRPLANQRMYVLDGALEPRPEWVPGDLYIGGDGLALGYWRAPGLTAAAFVTHPRTGERLYRTGDHARYRDDGALEFLGRTDLQVKVSGYRVELGEVEAALARQPGVAAGAVVAAGPSRGDRRLAAFYLVTPGADVDAAALRAGLAATLPSYLVPTTFTRLDALPLTGNGKLDRAALEQAAAPKPPGPAATERPADRDLERTLAGVWAEVLGVPAVDRSDNFFALGGTSLVGVALLARLEEALALRIPLVRLFEAPTVAELAAVIADARAASTPPTLTPQDAATGQPALRPDPAARHEPFPLTPVQQAYWMGRRSGLALGNVATHSYLELDVAGLDVARLERAVRHLVDRHDALRTVVTPGGDQQVQADVPPYRIAHRDLRGEPVEAAAAVLDATRARMSHQVHPADRWPLFELATHRLDDRRTRLHLSVDLLVADARSFRILARELVASYDDPAAALPAPGCTFRDYVLAVERLRDGPAHRRAQTYWRDRLAQLPPGPALPVLDDAATAGYPAFERLEGRLAPEAWDLLRKLGAEHNVTPSGLLCAAFADVLAMWSQQRRFTVNLTTFNRLPLHPDVDALVGDFTSTTLLAVDASAITFADRAAAVQGQIFRDLEHRTFTGVDVLRLLRADPRRRADALAPIVFTSMLMPELDSVPAPQWWDAEPVYSISQTPQVLLDHQVYEHAGGLVYTWDHVAAAFPSGVIGAMFEAYGQLLGSLTTDRGYWKAEPAWTR